MSKSIRNVYLELIERGKINHDKKQIDVLDVLEELEKKLLEPAPPRGLFERIFRKKHITNKGLYLWGSVGRGKSMLMDLFFDHIPITQKRRFHYLAFIQEIHDRLKEIRHDEVDDVIPPLANILLQNAKLLCLDEFQIDNVTGWCNRRQVAREFVRTGNNFVYYL